MSAPTKSPAAPRSPRSPRIDPRLKARRVAVQRQRGRRRLRRLAALGAVVAVLGLAVLVTRSPLLDVDHIDVRGAEHTTAGTVRAALGIDIGDALLYADLRNARRAVEQLPWVEEARLSRNWPGTIRVTVVERTAAGLVPAEGGGWFVADGSGTLLERVDEPAPGLPRLVGVAPGTDVGALAGEDARRLLAVLVRLPAALEGRVVSTTTDGADIRLEVVLGEGPDARSGGAVPVRFGPAEQVEEKLLALTALLAEVDPAGVTAIDVRVPSVPVVTRGSRP